MNYLGVHLTPDLLEEGWRELERERERERRIREARAARPSPIVGLAARLRDALRPVTCPRPEGC